MSDHLFQLDSKGRDPRSGEPIFEILKDGQPFLEDVPGAKERFRFRVAKGKMLLASIKVIRLFVDSHGVQPGKGNPCSIESLEWKVNCVVRYHDRFKKYGRWIEKSYLSIVGESRIGIGLLKAEAILKLETKLRAALIPYK